MKPVHVLLVREADMQMSSSGCCGRIEGDASRWSDQGCVFPQRRRIMEEMGTLYRAIRDRFGDRVRVDAVDPRNLFSYTALMWQAGRRAGLSPVRLGRNWMKGFTSTAVLVDGSPVAAGSVPETEKVIRAIQARLSEEPVA
ncbi:hypothetical protein C8P63_11850 [Melghirimyces profundicolus]|uniref:Uncharacterized protein n=1 Tax=Melghirimyces profundicolus TaxID=1242148 RepID=A0A2T6BQ67_9BACL|nr:hypothetical protein [Melghirimyces profundicolus]PTX58176.1 hypothetical protein C8P63_11850 [Melghirimyces profundicolus]